MTVYNVAHTIRQALENILCQLDERFELVVVDNFSGDGSGTILKEYSRAGKLKLIQARCSRGRGRQIAFENSSGDYIVANMDADDTFNPVLKELLLLYHERCEGKLLSVRRPGNPSAREGGAIQIAPRSLLEELGGWHDLNYYEDREICARAELVGKYVYAYFPLVNSRRDHPERVATMRSKMSFIFLQAREQIRIGIFPHKRFLNLKKLPIYAIAWLASLTKPHYTYPNLLRIASDKHEGSPWQVCLSD